MKIFCKLACVVILVGVLFAVSAMPVSADPSGWVLWEWHWTDPDCPWPNGCNPGNVLAIPPEEYANVDIDPPLDCSYGAVMFTGYSGYGQGTPISVTMLTASTFNETFTASGYKNHNGRKFEYIQFLNNDPNYELLIYDVLITCVASSDRVARVVTYGEGGMALSNLFTAGILLLSIVIRLGERFLGK